MTEKEQKTQTIQWIVTGIALALGLYNQIAQLKGWIHVEIVDSEITKYVTWVYELITGLIAFWYNQNITNDSKISQVVLDKLKNNSITPAQVEEFLNNDTIQLVSEELAKGNVTNEQIMTFLTESQLKEIADAHNNGQTVNVNIQEA